MIIHDSSTMKYIVTNHGTVSLVCSRRASSDNALIKRHFLSLCAAFVYLFCYFCSNKLALKKKMLYLRLTIYQSSFEVAKRGCITFRVKRLIILLMSETRNARETMARDNVVTEERVSLSF